MESYQPNHTISSAWHLVSWTVSHVLEHFITEPSHADVNLSCSPVAYTNIWYRTNYKCWYYFLQVTCCGILSSWPAPGRSFHRLIKSSLGNANNHIIIYTKYETENNNLAIVWPIYIVLLYEVPHKVYNSRLDKQFALYICHYRFIGLCSEGSEEPTTFATFRCASGNPALCEFVHGVGGCRPEFLANRVCWLILASSARWDYIAIGVMLSRISSGTLTFCETCTSINTSTIFFPSQC